MRHSYYNPAPLRSVRSSPAAVLLSLVMTLALYASVAFFSPGTEDDIFNIVNIGPTTTYSELY